MGDATLGAMPFMILARMVPFPQKISCLVLTDFLLHGAQMWRLKAMVKSLLMKSGLEIPFAMLMKLSWSRNVLRPIFLFWSLSRRTSDQRGYGRHALSGYCNAGSRRLGTPQLGRLRA